jgi:hypothetical protein
VVKTTSKIRGAYLVSTKIGAISLNQSRRAKRMQIENRVVLLDGDHSFRIEV